MGNTTVEYEDLLDTINDEKAMLMKPVIVYVSAIMLAGLLGNVMVFFYYGRKTLVTSNSTFIMALAVFDLITCVVSIPIEIVDLRLYYTFHNVGACKVMKFFNHAAAIGCTIILLAIATDRYRKICSPFKSQLTVRTAKVASFIAGGVSLFLACPALVLYEPVKVSVDNSYNITLVGSDCTTTKADSYQIYLWLYDGIYAVMVIVVTLTLAVLYCLIGRVVFRHHEMRVRLLGTPHNSSAMDLAVAVAVTSTSVSVNPDDKDRQLETSSVEHEHVHVSVTATTSNGVTYSNGVFKKVRDGSVTRNDSMDKSTRRKRSSIAAFTDSLHIKTMKYTIIMFAITITFVVSSVPYLALVLWRTFRGGYEGNYMSDSEDVLFNIGLRSYLLSAAINPLMYGFFNAKFRKYFSGILCHCCTETEETPNLSITSEGH